MGYITTASVDHTTAADGTARSLDGLSEPIGWPRSDIPEAGLLLEFQQVDGSLQAKKFYNLQNCSRRCCHIDHLQGHPHRPARSHMNKHIVELPREPSADTGNDAPHKCQDEFPLYGVVGAEELES